MNTMGKNQEIAVQCNKCKLTMETKDTLLCSSCNNRYHFDCAGVSAKLHQLKTAEKRKQWKCKKCMQIKYGNNSEQNNVTQRKKVVRKENTGIKHTKPDNNCTATSPQCQKIVRPQSTNTLTTSTPETSSITTKNASDPQSRVAERKKYNINISTDNSFESLPTDVSSNNEDVSSCIEKSILNRSCPDVTYYSKEELTELKHKVTELEMKLKIADQQIDQLVLENGSLKKQIKCYEKKNNTLSQICRSTPTKEKKSKERKNGNKTNVKYVNLTQPLLHPDNDSTLNQSNLHDEIPDLPILETSTENIGDNQHNAKSSTFEKEIEPKHKIIVLGDEQALGLSAKLLKNRANNWNDQYEPSALIKPHASSSETLNDCINIKEHLTVSDYVVICTGSHDRNPKTVIKNICIALNELRNANVIILPVNHSQYLNEKMLNNEIKLFTSGFSNCIFVNQNQVRMGHHQFIDLMCLKINVAIDYPLYESCYLKDVHRIIIPSPSNNNKPIGYPKGTIPYYFKVQPKPKNCTHEDLPPTLDPHQNISFFRAQ